MNHMNRFKMIMLMGVICLLAGAALLWHLILTQGIAAASPSVRPVTSATTSLAAPAVASTPATITGNPTNLTIDSLGLNLQVIPGVYDTASKTWTLSKDKVQFATVTTPPNNAGGNTFIYGHYRKGVFSTLHSIPEGAKAVITTDNGHKFYYVLDSVRVTDPTDDSLFQYQGAPILTIQTCSGLFFQHRQLFTFHLEKTV